MRTFIIADNQDLTCAGWIYLIDKNKPGTPFQKVHNKKELIDSCTQNRQAIIILDYVLFDFKCVREVIFLQEKYPETDWIISSAELSEDAVRTLLFESKKISILPKDSSTEDLISAIKQVTKGERYISSFISNMLLKPSTAKPTIFSRGILTTTEQEILKDMALGKSTREIAARRNTSMHTVMTHRKNIFRKIEVNNVYEATKYAIKAGLVDLAEYYI